MNYICTECLEIKTEKEMVKYSRFAKKTQETKYYFYDCHDCKNIRSRNFMMNKRAEKNPERFNSCNLCDRTFSKFSDHKISKNDFEVRGCCPFCSSTDFCGYA